MDPVMKLWMFTNWLEDTNENVELFKHHGYLIGSFINPEAVKSLTGSGNSYSVSEEEFDETTQIVRESILKNIEKETSKQIKRRRRKKK